PTSRLAPPGPLRESRSITTARSSSTDRNSPQIETIEPLLFLILASAFAWSPIGARADDAKPYPRISEEAFKARLEFFDYDKAVPLDGRVVRQWDEEKAVRQKIVFRGAQGFLVPGYIEFPKSGP